MKKFALCIHDLRASDGAKITETISFVREAFKSERITIHLVMDKDVSLNDETFRILKNEVDNNYLEIVFHGVSHTCPEGTSGLLKWYHKNNAEFLGNDFNSEANRLRYNQINGDIQSRTGICPPCWIAGRMGWKFIKSLSPFYIEKLLSFDTEIKQLFSLPVSLASNKKTELYFLKILASLITSVAILTGHSRVRLVVHTIDITMPDSVKFLNRKKTKLIRAGYSDMLQKDLLI